MAMDAEHRQLLATIRQASGAVRKEPTDRIQLRAQVRATELGSLSLSADVFYMCPGYSQPWLSAREFLLPWSVPHGCVALLQVPTVLDSHSAQLDDGSAGASVTARVYVSFIGNGSAEEVAIAVRCCRPGVPASEPGD